MSRIRSQLSYANVMATIGVFIALGGTSYAVAQLPRNSVGAEQIRARAVRGSEIKSGAIRSSDIANRSVALRDMSLGARRSLRGHAGPPGPQGPPGPAGTTLGAAVNSGGGVARGVGVATSGHAGGSGEYEVRFNRDVGSCFAVATLSEVPGGGTAVPPSGEIVTAIAGSSVFVRTRNSSGVAADLPFHLIVSC
jgi:hypothetical protein